MLKLLKKLPVRVRAPIAKKMQFYQNYTISQLQNNRKYLELIKGMNLPVALWELKFPSDPPFRAVCMIKENKIIVLEVFQGSGSDGEVRKWIPKALKKVDELHKLGNQ